MSRGLAWFVGLMLALVVALGFGLWWMGPTLANLAVLDGKRSESYAVLDLVQTSSPEIYDARYAHPVAELVRSEEGVAFGQYRLDHVFAGRVADESSYLRLLEFPAATDLVRVLTSTPYRIPADNLEHAKLLKLGSHAVAVEGWRPVVVVWLIDQTVEDAIANPMAVLVEQAVHAGGRLLWETPVDCLAPRPGDGDATNAQQEPRPRHGVAGVHRDHLNRSW